MKTPLFAKCRTLGAFAALLFVTTLAQAAPSLVISPSRTSGTGPLYVFFDATGTTNLAGGSNALANADFSWDFDTTNVDPNGTWEQTKGMVAGHVFEAPGTYTVSCTVTGADGTTDTDTVTITVSAFSGTTYYVAANGNNSNPGTQAAPWLTTAHAFSQLSANERILFRRGDTFPGSVSAMSNRSGGPMILGAYGTGAAPVLNTRILLRNCHDLRMMDLHLVLPGVPTAIKPEDASSHILSLRMEVEGTNNSAISQDDSDTFGVFDCHLHGIFRLGVFAQDSTRFSWVGNFMEDLDGTVSTEHGMRLQGGEKQFVAHNVFTHLIATENGITIRGDGQRHVMIYGNVLDRKITVNPTKAGDHQVISHVVIEGNYLGQNAAYEGTKMPNSGIGINIKANHVVVRNNVIECYRFAVSIAPDLPAGVFAEYVDVYNNTVNWRDYSDEGGIGGIIVGANDANYITVRNNLISAPTLGQATFSSGSGNTNMTVSNNLATITPGYVVDPLPDPAAHINSPLNYALLPTSPAVNAGANDVPVYYDLEGFPRPAGSARDLGAFEFDEGDSTPAITTTTVADAVQGSAYSQTLAASGGDAPLTWSVVSGSLPAGLSLSTGGVISGTPTGAGTSSFTVQVIDNDSDTDTQGLSLFVDSIPSITTTTLPNGTQGSVYSQTLAASGGNSPLSWSVASGSLPAGLSLSSGGVIMGTPTASGTSNFTVQVSDADSDTDTQALSLVIASGGGASFTYLQLQITGGIAGQTEGRIAEIDWVVGAAEYPNPHFTAASGNITHTGNAGWESYDGSVAAGSFWNLTTTTGTITLQLGSAISPTAIRVRPVNQTRAPASFVVRGSTDGTNWTVLASVTGLTSTTWSNAGSDLTFGLSY